MFLQLQNDNTLLFQSTTCITTICQNKHIGWSPNKYFCTEGYYLSKIAIIYAFSCYFRFQSWSRSIFNDAKGSDSLLSEDSVTDTWIGQVYTSNIETCQGRWISGWLVLWKLFFFSRIFKETLFHFFCLFVFFFTSDMRIRKRLFFAISMIS